MANKPAFEINSLSKKYKRHEAVSNLTFSGYHGEIIGFLGPNGAGKTTTIKMMTGLSSITSGSVQICGYSIQNDYEKAAGSFGAVVEIPGLYRNLTGSQNLDLLGKARKLNAERINESKTMTGLGKRLNDKVKTYSLGMKQRLGIAAALLGHPGLLILDEPTNGLDPVAIRDLRLFLKQKAHDENVCVLVSSHMLWEMEKLCDRVIIINDGKMIGEIPIIELCSKQMNLEDYYISCVEKLNRNEGINNAVSDRL